MTEEKHVETKHTPMGCLHTPLAVRVTQTHGVSIFDANDSSLGFDFERDTAEAIIEACNAHATLQSQLAEMGAALQRLAPIALERADFSLQWHGGFTPAAIAPLSYDEAIAVARLARSALASKDKREGE